MRNGCEVRFETEVKDEKIISANSILLECMLSNLIVNAIRHTPEGEIDIFLYDNGRLVIVNPGHKPLNPECIFQRFKSGDSGTKGACLGLAIVKAICEFHGWTVTYDYKNRHHVFTVLMK